MKHFFCVVFCLIAGVNVPSIGRPLLQNYQSDVCVYGASPAGIFAAIAAAREGYSVTIIEPTHKIGGLLGSGFRMQQDAPSGAHLGGLTGYYYKKDVALPPLRHYQAAEKFNLVTFQNMIDAYKGLIQVVTDYRVKSVDVLDRKIQRAHFEHAPSEKYGAPAPHSISGKVLTVTAKVFIDASYEGDLMAFSGVAYRVGKESRQQYGESLAGVIISRRFSGIDPYKEAGNPASGVLDGISTEPLGKEGDSSRFFMGYNFKLAWEREPDKEHPGLLMEPPEHKNEDLYELLKRYKNAGYAFTWPEENFRRGELVTGAFPGMQTDYPDGDWRARNKIWRGYIGHIKMLNDFAGTAFRFISGINAETDGWPFLYIRGGRRMVGEYVMTQQDIQLQTAPPTPVGLGYYKVDIYPNRLVVLEDGTLAEEGNVYELVSPGPYQIPYGSLIPRKEECSNLIVPLCISASHVAYSSIRMESTYMVMGESAGIAAALAVKTKKTVQGINRKELTNKLKQHGQIVEWDGYGYHPDYYRSNIFGRPNKQVPWWEKSPEEYKKYPVSALRKGIY